MGKIEWSFCHDDDWLTYALAWVLLYPYVVWVGFFIAGFVLFSPILMYVSKVSSIGTYLISWGLQVLLDIRRPHHQDCEQSLAVPDTRFVIGVVNILTVLGIVVTTRKSIHPWVVLSFVLATVLYFVAVTVNQYLSPIQFMLSFGLSLSMSAFWIATYGIVVRPILIAWGYRDLSLLGIERVNAYEHKRRPLNV